MTTLSDKQLHDLARLGAIARLKELDQEAAALRKMFPGMKQVPEHAPEHAPAAPKVRRRKGRMRSEAARKAHSEKMKAYWAKKRGEQAAPAPEPEAAGKAQATNPAETTRLAPARNKTAPKRAHQERAVQRKAAKRAKKKG